MRTIWTTSMACDNEPFWEDAHVSDLRNTDMLDDFSTIKIESKQPEASAPGPGRPSTTSAPASKDKPATAEDDVLSDDDFAKQLQAGMAELMGEMENSV